MLRLRSMKQIAARHTARKIAQRKANAAAGFVHDSVENRVEDLEIRLDLLEENTETAAYLFGTMIAAILSWHSFHAVLWAILAGIFSWLYVIYYVVVHWAEVKLI
jgi:hypothetical protein